MSTTVTLPDFWMLFNPQGKADGSMHPVSLGVVRYPTAEDAWKEFTPNTRTRDREKRQGWQVIGVEQADFLDYWEGRKSPEPTKEETR